MRPFAASGTDPHGWENMSLPGYLYLDAGFLTSRYQSLSSWTCIGRDLKSAECPTMSVLMQDTI
jgi:hypothetical protein